MSFFKNSIFKQISYFLNQFNFSEMFPVTFTDPATVIAYNLFSVHHDAFFFIIIIISLVYWSLYKILKDFSWHISTKQHGIIKVAFYNIVPIEQELLVYVTWLKFLKVFLFIYYHFLVKIIVPLTFYIKLSNFEDNNNFLKKTLKSFLIFIGLPCFYSGLQFPLWFFRLPIEPLKDIHVDRYLSYYLYSYTNNCRLFHDIEDDYLITQMFNHSTKLEFVFAFFPTFVITSILVPSLYLLFSFDEELEPVFTIKVIGHQWYWSYEWNINVLVNQTNLLENDSLINETKDIVINKQLNFDSVMLDVKETSFLGDKRLLAVDNVLTVPAKVTLRFIVTSEDVLHSWAIPAFGVKIDAVPGRLNEVIFNIEKPGRYYGQCSELCGVGHGFMPIAIDALPWNQFLNKLND